MKALEVTLGKSRDDLLAEAAEKCDALAHVMGGDTDQAPPPEASIRLREFRADEARFSDRPDIYKLTGTEAFAHAQLPVVIADAEYSSSNDYYLVSFPFDLSPAGPYKFNELKVYVNFTAEQKDYNPKVQAIFPSTKLREILKSDLSLEISVKPEVGFKVTTGQIDLATASASGPGVKASASATGGAKAEAAFGVGPIKMRWYSALVETSSPGLEWVRWQIGGAELHQEQTPRLMVVLQVPHRAGAISASGEMTVSRYYNLFSRAIRNLAQLPQVYREFIEAGVPLKREQSWKDFIGRDR